MCFSATASFAAGTALSIGGGVTIKKAKTKSEIPFAAIPLFFGIQQLIEGVVWISFSTPWVNSGATFAYSMFSHVLWPIFLPLSILLLEKNRVRRKILFLFLFIGAGVGLYFFYFLVKAPVTSAITNNSIDYISPHFYALPVIILYLSATCLSCLFSSHRMVNILGVAVFLSFLIAFQFFNATVISVWCFFAAILSVIVYLHFAVRKT